MGVLLSRLIYQPDQNTIAFRCPAKECGVHRVNIGLPIPNKTWTWNGDLEKPTFKPSINASGVDPETGEVLYRCHSHVKDGMIQFLGDCTHELKGQTVPLVDYYRA